MFNKYTSLPKEIMAVQFLEENKDRVFNSLTGQFAADFENDKPIIKVKTIQGDTAIVRLGDWIVKEKELGFYYPVKDVVFRAGYKKIIFLDTDSNTTHDSTGRVITENTLPDNGDGYTSQP